MTPNETKMIKIQIAHQLLGKQVFDIELRDNMSEFRSNLCQSTALSIFQNFHFQHNGKKVSEYQQVAQAFALPSDVSEHYLVEVNVVMEPFTDRSSRHHFSKIKKILKNPVIWAVLTNKESQDKIIATMSNNLEKEQHQANELDSLLQKPLTSNLIQPKTQQKFEQFVKFLNYSGYNPAPYYRKLAGDFYYLHLCTIQGNQFHITANPLGFIINNSSNSHFNPLPSANFSKKSQTFQCLLQLLAFLSPKFSETFSSTIKKIQVTQLDRMMNSSFFSFYEQDPLNIWLKEPANQKQVYYWHSEGLDEDNIKQVDPNTIKDWNQLFQMQAELPGETLLERLNKEKLKYKLYQEWTEFAKKGAVNIVQDRVLSTPVNNFHVNSQYVKKNHLYTIGSLLFTVTQESPYHFGFNRKKTNDAAPSGKQVDNSLKYLALVQRLAIPQVHLVHMLIIKYRGYKIVVQCIVSQIPQRNTEKTKKQLHQPLSQKEQTSLKVQIKYGNDSLAKICKKLQLTQQVVTIDQAKGSIDKSECAPHLNFVDGGDNRKYLGSLYKLAARDFNFQGSESENCVLRQQLIQLYKQKQKCTIPINPLIGTHLKIKYSQKTKQEQQKLKSIAKFAKQIVVPMFISNICNNSLYRKKLSDTKGVMQIVHKMGLSSRYLGFIYDQASEQEYPHLKLVIQRVILVKTLKNIFRMVMRESDLMSLKETLVRMLNCIFCQKQIIEQLQDELSNNNQQELSDSSLYCKDKQDGNTNATLSGSFANNYKKKKKKNKERERDDSMLQLSIPQKANKYINMKPSQFWQIVKKIAVIRYLHKLPDKIKDLKGFSSQFRFNKLATLRDLCLNLGLILQKKQYLSQDWRCFSASDIIEFRPLCKHIPIQCKDLLDIIQEGDKMANKCLVQESIDCYNKAVQYIMANFGGMHQKLAVVHKKLSNIYFRIGQIQTALLFSSHSCYIFQSLYGQDHTETIQNYILLAFYHFSKRNFATAQHFMLKGIHLNLICYGQCYPQLVVDYLNLSTIYESQKKFADAIMSIVSGLNLILKIYGQNHIHVAICYSALAALHYEIPDIQQSINYQLKAVEILGKILKEDDLRFKQSKIILQYYKNLQNTKKIKQVHQKQQKKLEKIYSGMQLFKMPEPAGKQKEQFLTKMNKFGRKKYMF